MDLPNQPQHNLAKIILSIFLIFSFSSTKLTGNTVPVTGLDADLLTEGIFRYPGYLGLEPEYLTGDASIDNTAGNNRTLVRFHSRTKDSLVYTPNSEHAKQCPWKNSELCTDPITIDFIITRGSEEAFHHILTLALEKNIRITFSRNTLEKKFYFQISARNVITRIFSVSLTDDSERFRVQVQVNLIEATFNRVKVNDQLVDLTQVPVPTAHQPKIIVEDNDFIGLVFGESTGSFGIGDFDIYYGKDEKRILYRRNADYYRQQGNLMSLGQATKIDFTNSGYVAYDFSKTKKIPSARHEEKISLKFMIPYGNTEGLLWKASGSKSETLIYIKNLKLYYYFRTNDTNLGASRTLTEEVVLNKELKPDVVHHLIMERNNEMLTVRLDEVVQDGILTENSALLPENGVLYLGGSPNIYKDSDKRVNNDFRGNISEVVFIIDQNKFDHKEYDLIKMATDPYWQGLVIPHGGVSYKVDITKDHHSNLAIGPTAGYDKPSESVYQKQPVYLDGTNQAVVRATTWDFDRRPFFEIEFRTLEPEGVLFFVGPDDQHTDFICIEIYDGNVYFVYGIQNHYRHIQMNADFEKVNDGRVHRVYVERKPNNELLTKFDGKDVSVDQKNNYHAMRFSTYTYFGSIDQPGRLPWYVWARKNFAGCILSVRIGENKYLDFTLIMNQHNDATTGVYLECRTPQRICNSGQCMAGTCSDRSEPFYKDSERFSCDCSASDQTYQTRVNILRSQKCSRVAPVIHFDGKSSRLIEFDRVKKTHTDDFRIQFKTSDPNAPIFHTFSPNANQYFRVDLYNGKIKVRTNMNRATRDPGDEIFALETTPVLSDDRWHYLKLNRRAQSLRIQVDNHDALEGDIPIKDGLTFNLIAQFIFLGSEAPTYFENFNIRDYTDYEKLDSSKLFFKGDIRNFYWNEYDLSGTQSYNGLYSTHQIAPKFKPPVLPEFRGGPNYPMTATAKLISVPILKQIDLEALGDTLMFYFKTKYDGTIIHMIDEINRKLPEFAVVLLDNKLNLVYNIEPNTGLYQWKDNRNYADDRWHRLALTLNRRDGQILMAVDNNEAQYVDQQFNLENLGMMKINVAGVADSIWRGLFNILRDHQPSKKTMHYTQRSPPFTGCFGGLSFKSEGYSSDWLQVYSSELSPSPSRNDIIPGRCIDVERCTPGICGSGRCEENYHDHSISCRCEPGFYGNRCEIMGETCYTGFCRNDGICQIINAIRTCDCRNTGFTGPQCERSPCDDNYCATGRCSMVGNRPQCDCYNTGAVGDRCEIQICRPGVCGNGRCRVSPSNQPECECSRTGFKGARCDIPLCKPNPCKNGGVCQISGNEEICDCRGTGYTGQYCIEPTCDNSNYCLNNGICRVDRYKNSLICDCTNTGFTGQRCQINPCDGFQCHNGGRCMVRNGRPECSCIGTGYDGQYCERSLCHQTNCNQGSCELRNGSPYCNCRQGYRGRYCSEEDCYSGFCMNGGSCSMYQGYRQCQCPAVYEGARCEHRKQCRPDYCLHGTCRVTSNGEYRCDCDRGYTGDKCENSEACPLNHCNGGKCTVTSSGSFVCDCSPTGRSGDRCQEASVVTNENAGREDSNAILSDYIKPGYLVYNLMPPKRTTKDAVIVGFETYSKDGTILTMDSSNNAYWAIRILDGTLMFEENGKRPFPIKNYVSNGEYHVVRIDRIEKLMNITVPGTSVQTSLEGYNPSQNTAIEYRRIIIGANSTEKDIFRGAIGGVHWNGEYIIDMAKENQNQFNHGVVTYIRLPSYMIHTPPLLQCDSYYCENRGTCMISDYQKKCDCRLIGYWGDKCEKHYYGYLDTDRDQGRYTKLVLESEKETTSDQMRFGFQTRANDGVLTHAEQTDGSVYHQIYLNDGYLWSNINGNKQQLTNNRVNDGRYHVVNLDRVKDQFKYYVDGNIKTISDQNIIGANGELRTKNIYVGADRNGNSNFKGLVGAFSWNDQEIISKQGSITQNTQIMKLPGNQIGSPDEVVITVMPSFENDLVIPPPLDVDMNVPAASGGGSLLGPNGDYILAGTHDSYMTGAGQSGIFPGGGTRIQQAGFGTGLPQISALAAGIILSLLLLLSGLIWACWKCKPGGCGKGSGGIIKKAASVFGGAGGEKDAYIGRTGPMNNNEGMMLMNDNMAGGPNYDLVETNEGTNLLTGGAYGAGAGGGFGAGAGGAFGAGTFGHGKLLDLSPGDLNSYRVEHNFAETGGPNVYSTDMKVDCCEISQNSKYAVTGSANGPPQIWDMGTGDLFKVMDGSELAARDLHLGCNDQVLVGQVVDENDMDSYIMSNGSRVRRLQLWHFQTGQQMEMQEKIMCSATCLTNRDKNDLIVARTQSPRGDSILVWDLIGNENKQEIFYNRISDAPVTFLKVSLDDRLVVAGLDNGEDQNCAYMVFDLCAQNSGVITPNYIDFDAEVNATEILSDFEAITGTRKGHLYVWNILTCEPIRQIQISAVIEENNLVALPAHNSLIHCVTLSKDGNFIVTGSRDQTVKVWNRAEERLIHSLEGHNDDVLSTFISPDSEVIVSGSWDGSIRVWRLRDGNQMCWFTSNIEILQVKLSNDKRAIVGLGERNGNRKLIMLQIIRNRTTVYGPNGSLSPSLGATSP